MHRAKDEVYEGAELVMGTAKRVDNSAVLIEFAVPSGPFADKLMSGELNSVSIHLITF